MKSAVDKYFNIAIMFTPVDEIILKIQSEPSPLCYGIFLKTVWRIFKKMFPGFFKVLFLNHKPAVISPSVRQSLEF